MAEFYERLKEAMKTNGVSQTELCSRTKIPKSAMSQYISGAFKPKQDRTYLIAQALNVSEAWLMGFDVPMNRKNDTPSPVEKGNIADVMTDIDAPDLSAPPNGEQQLIELYRQLNPEGQEKVTDYADDLVNSGKYKKSDTNGLAKEA